MPQKSDEKLRPITQKDYTYAVFFLMGQFMGVMDKKDITQNERFEELREIKDKMEELYLRSKASGL